MIETSQDVLYISLAAGFLLLSVFGSMALLYLVLVLRDVTKITDKLKGIVGTVNDYVLKPAEIAMTFKKVVWPAIQKLREEREEEEE